MEGIVKRFFTEQGYGFLDPQNDDEDIFVHYSAIESEDKFKTLIAGQRVSFDLDPNAGGKRLKAVNVKVIQ